MSQKELSKIRRCACGNIRLVSRSLTQFYDEIIQPSGLRITQFSLLSTIAREEAVTVSQLADVLVMDQTTVTHNLNLLEKQGLVERVVGQDRRVRVLKLTPEGQQALDRAIPFWEEAQAKAVERLGQERYRNLLKDLFILSGIDS